MVASVASAAGYNPNKDPNGDGVITVADATYIYQFLNGKYKVPDLTRLDVDDNAVVSAADSMYILMHDAGVLSTSLSETDSIDAVSASQSTREYSVYDAKTGAYKKNYSLSVDDYTNSVSTNSIVSGNYKPETNYDNRGTAKIICVGGSFGSGFVVGKHTIATAGHMVYDGSTASPRKISKILLFDANENPSSFTPVECHVPDLYKSNTFSSNYDYALITVKEDLSDYMSFNLGAITNEASNLSIDVVGFPKSYKETTYNNASYIHNEVLTEGSVISVDDKVFYHSADTLGGNSGGPVFVSETLNGITYNTVVGIHVGGTSTRNTSVRLTAEVLKFLNGNTNIEY
ncbi:MAG: trypsin-like peptidase domain-containing protein [Ruminococcus sp.]|nr:trypsin-like peptidase domain-containing protein [Ruminococcus sp.]